MRLTDPVLAAIGRIVHEADIGDDRYDNRLLELTGPLFDGLHAFVGAARRTEG